jgi:hypothetical protein
MRPGAARGPGPLSSKWLSSPVPRGRMATDGSGQARRCRISSRVASTQPTVPSPPHTNTRKQGTWENRWNLHGRQKVSHHHHGHSTGRRVAAQDPTVGLGQLIPAPGSPFLFSCPSPAT